MSDMMTLGGDYVRIKEYRKAKGMTQAELAAQMGVARTTVTMWETAGRIPYVTQLFQLARIFDCTIEDLFVAGK